MSTLRAERKMPAFTMLELLVGMIVSALVLATLFTAYHIVSRQAELYRVRSTEYISRSLLHSTITRDVLRADSTVVYEAKDTFVVRQCGAQTDTFFTNGHHEEEYFLKHERDQHQP